jgi:hypothetical protein
VSLFVSRSFHAVIQHLWHSGFGFNNRPGASDESLRSPRRKDGKFSLPHLPYIALYVRCGLRCWEHGDDIASLCCYVYYYTLPRSKVTAVCSTLTAGRSFRLPPVSSAAIIQDPRILSWQLQSNTVHCTSSFTLLFDVAFPDQEKQHFRLSLEPNHELFQNPKVEYIDNNGATTRVESIVRHEYKVYKGNAYVRDENNQWNYCGWTRITILRDGEDPLFEGVFLHDGEVHHVKLLSDFNARREVDDVQFGIQNPSETMIVYRDSDRYFAQASLLGRSIGDIASANEANVTTCGHDLLTFNKGGGQAAPGSAWDFVGRLVRRQNDVSGNIGGSRAQLARTIGNTNGCPTTRMVALVGAAADCAYVAALGNSSSTRSNIISVFNSVRRSLYLVNNRLLPCMKIN